jgi:hypothetical protein
MLVSPVLVWCSCRRSSRPGKHDPARWWPRLDMSRLKLDHRSEPRAVRSSVAGWSPKPAASDKVLSQVSRISR